MKDIEDKLAALLMDYGVLKNRDAEKMARKIAEMFEKEGELGDLKEVLKAEQEHRLAVESVRDALQSERDQLAAKFPDIGPDPLKLDGDDRKTRYSVEGSKAQLTKASCVQQMGVPDQTALVWRADLMKVCDDHTWRSVHLPALREMTKQRDQLAAKCAEMRGVLSDAMIPWSMGKVWKIEMATLTHALSSDCGTGWLSPEKAERLRNALFDVLCRFREWEATLFDNPDNTDLGQAIAKAKQVMEETK